MCGFFFFKISSYSIKNSIAFLNYIELKMPKILQPTNQVIRFNDKFVSGLNGSIHSR